MIFAVLKYFWSIMKILIKKRLKKNVSISHVKILYQIHFDNGFWNFWAFLSYLRGKYFFYHFVIILKKKNCFHFYFWNNIKVFFVKKIHFFVMSLKKFYSKNKKKPSLRVRLQLIKNNFYITFIRWKLLTNVLYF